MHSYATAYWWGAGFFAFGAVLSALVFRRKGDGLSVATGPSRAKGQPLSPSPRSPSGRSLSRRWRPSERS